MIAKNIVISARMFTDWKSKTQNNVQRASFRSFVYMGDDDDGVWLACLGAILTKGSLSESFVDIPSNYVATVFCRFELECHLYSFSLFLLCVLQWIKAKVY